MSRRRIVITGMGTVNPLAHSVGDYWKGLLAGQSGIGRITQISADRLEAFRVHFGGEVKDFDPAKFMDSKTARHLDRFAQLALAATQQAVTDSGLEFSKEDPDQCGAIIGTGIGGLNEFEDGKEKYLAQGPRRVSPFVIPKMMGNSAAGIVTIEYGLCGVSHAVSTACASAANAMLDALHTIRRGDADIIVTGGAESTITHMGLGGFCSAHALSTRNDAPTKASRPFDKDRDGFVLSEGAGILIFEELEHARRRGAKIYAEVLGAGASSDAYHITAPHPEGKGAAKAMSLALRNSGLSPESVDYINAHGTSTELGDACETQAIKTVFGEHARKLAISSTKSMVGHLLGASGGVELIATVLSIVQSVVHPTINYETPDPTCDLDYVPNRPREMRVRRALSNSFGFGGHNCCVAVGALG